ncbi:MAG: urease accessory protein UreF [Bifidobacterium tibiigranuli]|jgi:urease accessory protein|nr:urease accessory UreF family protein [Bifidobacterium tibiigranuli]MCH4203640.1 urease accessory protein UreF [Bifidobacterium tibiigranuli]MCH4274153.1 urease accessory protein UreF [Bifidobacterium tibiigranuli]MCI1790907.1 urease accessory protein UreF [Bifidobacterium tibiigranuli]MCI1797855.1 urease accessory protein UreF [Bifidobacterium tibiigranuli]
MNANETEARRLAMLQVCDSVFPVGAFALSNGMETFVQRDMLRRGGDFEEYVKNYLDIAPYKEIGQMVLAGKYASDSRMRHAGLAKYLIELDELASALQSAREIREGSERMCSRLVTLATQMDAGQAQTSDGHRSDGQHSDGQSSDGQRGNPQSDFAAAMHGSAGNGITDATDSSANANANATSIAKASTASSTAESDKSGIPHADDREHDIIAVHEQGTERHRLQDAADGLYGSPALAVYAELISAGQCRGLHPIAMGVYAADHAPDIRDAAIMYGYSLLSALTMCAAKAIPLSQYAGQVALHNSFPRLVRAVDIAMTLRPEDLGISGAFIDIAAMQHETLYSRLYMS